jgi:hypothetical protein
MKPIILVEMDGVLVRNQINGRCISMECLVICAGELGNTSKLSRRKGGLLNMGLRSLGQGDQSRFKLTRPSWRHIPMPDTLSAKGKAIFIIVSIRPRKGNNKFPKTEIIQSFLANIDT